MKQAKAHLLNSIFRNSKIIEELSSLATYQRDKDGKPSVYVYKSDVEFLTEKDLSSEQQALSYTDRNRPETFQGLVVHEIGHYQLDKLGYNDEQRKEQLFEQIGWVHRKNEANQIDDWLIKGKNIEADGKNATFQIGSEGFSTNWTRWSISKGPIDAVGNHVRAQDAQKLTEDQMRANALVPASTWYFDNPEEMYAEAFRMYKLDARSADFLKRYSPTLYAVVATNCASDRFINISQME